MCWQPSVLRGVRRQAAQLLRADDQINLGILCLGDDISLPDHAYPDLLANTVGKQNRLVNTIFRLRHIDILEIDGNIDALREFTLWRLLNRRVHGL
jgi:hypothetical protein